MKANKLITAALTGLLFSSTSVWANNVDMPVEDSGLLALSVLCLAAVIGIARGRNRR